MSKAPEYNFDKLSKEEREIVGLEIERHKLDELHTIACWVQILGIITIVSAVIAFFSIASL